MNGIDYVADTNILIYLLEARISVETFNKNSFCASVVSEIELMGWYKVTEAQKQILHKLVENYT